MAAKLKIEKRGDEILILAPLRDRPFNLKGRGDFGFLFRSEFFFSDARLFISCDSYVPCEMELQ
jgi:hypothetical protein